MADQPSDASSESSAENDEGQDAQPGDPVAESSQPDEAGGGDQAGPQGPPVAEAVGAVEAANQETPAGWYQDPNVPNQQRYWDGSIWTDQKKEADSSINTTKKSADERKALLARQIQGASARGLRVESQSEFQAVLVQGQPINHVLHAIITFFTCGLWGIVWIILALTGGEKREMTVVDEFGNVQVQRLGKA